MICHKCLHEWNYKPKTKGNYYATCPKCHYKVNIKKQKATLGKSIKNLAGLK